MSSAFHATDLRNAPRIPLRSPRFWKELPTRALFGGLLAVVAVAATLAGGVVFAGLAAIGAVVAVREWQRMVDASRFGAEAVVSSAAIVCAIIAILASAKIEWAFAILAGGAVATGAIGALKRGPPVLGGLGTLYIGIPALSIVALRTEIPDSQWIVLGMFLIIWAADTGALLTGQLVGGPKLFPQLSPNKTWAGLCGGLVLPALVAAGYVSSFGGGAWRGALAGLALATVGHCGDLFESWVKRRVGLKNSGGLIPGHGGILDRIDSTLFAAPVVALLFYFVNAAQVFGVAR